MPDSMRAVIIGPLGDVLTGFLVLCAGIALVTLLRVRDRRRGLAWSKVVTRGALVFAATIALVVWILGLPWPYLVVAPPLAGLALYVRLAGWQNPPADHPPVAPVNHGPRADS